MVGLKKLNWQEATSGYLHTSVAEDLNTGWLTTNPASGQRGIWTPVRTAGLRVQGIDHSATLLCQSGILA